MRVSDWLGPKMAAQRVSIAEFYGIHGSPVHNVDLLGKPSLPLFIIINA
jgi:hypothetical protein